MNRESSPKVIIGIYSSQNRLFVSNPILKKIIRQLNIDFPLTFVALERLTNLSNQLDEIFWLIDKNGKILLINNIFAKLLGQEKAKIEGKNYIDFIPSSQVKIIMMIDNYVKDTNELISIEDVKSKLFHLPPDKQFIIYPVLNAKKNLAAIAGFSISKSTLNTIQVTKTGSLSERKID
jgi:transcriptional regulator with PAS, ATPase and Fis domain